MADRQMLSSEPPSRSEEGELGAGHHPWTAPFLSVLILYILSGAPALAAQPSVNRMIVSVAFGLTLVLLSTIDIRSQRLPDVLTLPLLAAGILTATFVGDDWTGSLIAACIGFLALYGVGILYRHVRGKHGLGLGDAKLLAASGAWVGLAGLPSVLLFASVSGIALVCAATPFGFHVTRDTRIPFGPFLSFATWIVWLYGSLV